MDSKTIIPSPKEAIKARAAKAGQQDKIHGFAPNAQKHGAKAGSAWEQWYFDGYYKIGRGAGYGRAIPKSLEAKDGD